jgi:hypothetical protein
MVADTSLMRSGLGVDPSISLAEGLARVARAHTVPEQS